MKQFCFIFLFLSLPLSLHSQENGSKKVGKTSVEAVSDEAKIQPRYPSSERLDDYRNNRDYNYERNTPPPQSLLARFWEWLMEQLSAFFESSSYESFWQYVILAVIGGLAIWLLSKAEFLGGLFGRKAEEAPLAYNHLTENIHELDFNILTEEAIEQHNYRLAIRLYYLKALKQLTDKQLIHWQPTKTNRVYVHELENTILKTDFEHLTSQFEFVWYGEFLVSASAFGLLKEQFQAFSGKI